MSAVEFPLRLVPLARPARDPVAWVLPGDDPAAWLEGLAALAAALGEPAGAFDLWVVPDAGLLASVAGRDVEVRSAALSCLAQPCGLLGERLLVPVDGALAPDVTGVELDQALAPGLHLLHPVAGLVRLAPEARLDVCDLLARPPEVEGAWRALEPPTAPLRLVALDVEEPPSLEAWIREGAAGVAEAPPSQAPPAPGEEQQGGAGAWVSQQAARFVQWAAGAPEKKDPATQPPPNDAAGAGGADGAGGGLVDRLLRWSEETLANVKDARQRELDRLLHLLDADPDEGLRYALPLTGDASGGPPAPPGAKLPPRHVDYGAGASRRGASADPWEIDLERHRRLVERYRELASRELRLGRYRRAAYVLAELLGDLSAAASALEQGRHFREAAALYRDRLGRPLEAARCLERGGLLVEAATLYEGEGRWVEAGDVWGRLERADDARRAYRRAVQVRLELDDPLSAARLLETKLDATDEALDVLAATWPDHPQAGLCLEDRLGLLARGARHDAARGVLDLLRQDPRRGGRELLLARALGSIASRYPEAGVQARARDLARVVSGERLARRPGPDEAEALLQVISRLDPGDRLLGRDVGRMSAQLRRDAAKALVARPVVRGEGWTPKEISVRPISASSGTSWRVVELDPAGVVWAAGTGRTGRIVLCRHGSLVLEHHWAAQRFERLLLAPLLDGQPLTVLAAGARPLETKEFLADGELPACMVGTPTWLDPSRALALASNGAGVLWVLSEDQAQGHYTLASYHGPGRLLGTCALSPPEPAPRVDPDLSWLDLTEPSTPVGPVLMRATADGRLVVALGEHLLRFEGTAPLGRWSLGGRASDLAIHETRAIAAVSLPDGGRVLFLYDHDAQGRFGEGLAAPRIAFTPDGLLVAVTKDEGRVYLVHERRIEHKGTFAGPGKDVLCVRPTGRARSVLVVTTDGTLRELEFTRS